MIGQKEAVIDAVKALLGPTWIPGSYDVRAKLTKAQYRHVVSMVANGIANGTVKYSKSLGNYSEVFRYTQGMVANHMKKAVELNGGVKITAAGAPAAPVDLSIYPEDLQNAIAEYIKR